LTTNIIAVTVATAAASGSNIKMVEAGILEIMSIVIVSAHVKSNDNGEIVGMRRLYVSINGFQSQTKNPMEGSESFYITN
jgi:hypothetical protein